MTLPPLWPVFDGHNDLLLNLWLQHDDDPVSAFYSHVTPGHLDFPRMRRGGFCGGLFAVFIPPVSYIAQMRNQTLEDAQAAFDPLAIAERQIAILHQLERASQGQLRLCRTATEIEQCRLEGQIAAVLHIEGAGMIDAALTQLAAFYRLG
ncbi:membrane dipeptidase, partial [Serratia marcescens]